MAVIIFQTGTEVSFKSIVHGIAKTILIVVFIWLLLRVIDFISLLLKEKARVAGGIKDHQIVVFFQGFPEGNYWHCWFADGVGNGFWI